MPHLLHRPLLDMRVSRQSCINFIWIEVENFRASAWGLMRDSILEACRQAGPHSQPQKVGYYPWELLWA